MIRQELASTLLALIDGVQPPPGAGLLVTEVLMEIPLEINSGIRNGKLVFYGSPPHSRWKAGVLPEVHQGRLHIVTVPTERETT